MSLDGDLDFLTPSHLLTITSNILMPPAGNFQEIDGYDSVKDGNGFSTSQRLLVEVENGISSEPLLLY